MFLVDILQKDIRNETKLNKVFEFIFYLGSIIKNKEISEKIFEFFFGLSLNNEFSIKPESKLKIYKGNNDDDDESIIYIKKNMIDGLGDIEDVDYLSNNNFVELVEKKLSGNNINYLSNEKILQKIITNSTNANPNLTEVIKTEIEKIDKDNHKYEEIIATLIKIIEGNQTDLKILLLNCFNNIIQNSPKLFLSEMLIPYYKTSMNPNNINEIVQYD